MPDPQSLISAGDILQLRGVARCISDLHLQPGDERNRRRLAAFLEDCGTARISALFILGDLFEYWIGDDQQDELADWLAAQLSGLSRCGTALYFMPGNRDFLLGTEYAARCGMQRLPEAQKVGVGGTAHLLMHGDTLCTDDMAYQQFRRMVRDPAWQTNFLARPLPQRLAEVAALRQKSREAMQGKSAEIMDVNQAAVRAALVAHGCGSLIHGHTHRPARHDFDIDGRACQRWVLADWTAQGADALEIDAQGVRRLPLA